MFTAARSGDKKMISAEVILLIFGTIFTGSLQQSLIQRNPYKGLRGIVPSATLISAGMHRSAFHHDQTIAIFDTNEKREIINCDVIEVYETHEKQDVFKKLSPIPRPTEVTFTDMTYIMNKCDEFDRIQDNKTGHNDTAKDIFLKVNKIRSSAMNLLFGIVPETKWCGRGDVADNYHDLGPERNVDRCCRSHDLCPEIIRARTTRYNLTNSAKYTKSHCLCDKAFYHCLKNVPRSKANIVGTLYFNVLTPECVDDVPMVQAGDPAKKFSKSGLIF